MEKAIKTIGYISNGLLLVALAMFYLRVPNYALLIILGLLLMMFIAAPAFLIYLNRNNPTRKGYNFLVFLATLLFTPMLFFSLQQALFPFKIAIALAVLSGIFIAIYFTREMLTRGLTLGKSSFLYFYLLFVLLLVVNVPIQLQAPDYSYNPRIDSPAYPTGEGPVILFDEAHNNIHKLSDRFLATGRMLERDGYRVNPLREKIDDSGVLDECRIIIVCNALNDKNVSNWSPPIHSAFTHNEIENIKNWVFDGGSLLLIVNHMPLPGAAYDLASEFGFELKNGHARQIPRSDNFFTRRNATLGNNVITNGMNAGSAVDSILTYDGSGFLIPENAVSILSFDSNFFQWEPQRVWDYQSVEPYSLLGYSQGAYKKFGNGRVAVYGDAMMFTAQLGAGLSFIKLGMNSPKAQNNYQLFLNTIHWLDGVLE